MIDWRWWKLYQVVMIGYRGREREGLIATARILRARQYTDRRLEQCQSL